MENFRHLMFFLEYVFLPLLAIFFAFYIKAKLNARQTINHILEDLEVDFRIISSLGIGLYGLSLIGHNDHDSGIFDYYGFLGILITLIFSISLLLKVLNNNRKMPTISLSFFGLFGNSIYKVSCLQIYCLYLYVVIGLIFKKFDDHFDYYYLIVISIVTLLFFVYINRLLNFFVIKLLNTQGVYTFDFLYESDQDLSDSSTARRKKIAEVSHFLANRRENDPSTIPLLQSLSELYEDEYEYQKSVACINRIIEIYEDKNINMEDNNIIAAYLYKLELLRRMPDENTNIESIINLLKSRFPNNKRVQKL